MARQVAIDCDFFQHLIKIERHSDVKGLITNFFSALEVEPAAHPFVYDHEMELMLNQVGRELFQDGVIRREDPGNIWGGSQGQKNYYANMVRQLYKDFSGEEYPCDVFTQWQSGRSLGEVHTAVMCAFLEWGYFFSDDWEAGHKLSGLLQNRMAFPIEILNRDACCDSLRGKKLEERCGLTGNDLKKLSRKTQNETRMTDGSL